MDGRVEAMTSTLLSLLRQSDPNAAQSHLSISAQSGIPPA